MTALQLRTITNNDTLNTGTIAIGDVLSSAGTSDPTQVQSGAGGGVVKGIALAAATAPATVSYAGVGSVVAFATVATHGVLPGDPGPGPVVVGSGGRCLRKDLYTADDQLVGFSDAAGNVTIAPSGLPFRGYRDRIATRGVVSSKQISAYFTASGGAAALNKQIQRAGAGVTHTLPAGRQRHTESIDLFDDAWYPSFRDTQSNVGVTNVRIEGTGYSHVGTQGTAIYWDGPDLAPGVRYRGGLLTNVGPDITVAGTVVPVAGGDRYATFSHFGALTCAAANPGTGTYTFQISTDAANSFNATTPWVSGHAYVYGCLVIPTAANGSYYKCITKGTSSAQPAWTTTVGDTFQEPAGGPRWQCVGPVATTFSGAGPWTLSVAGVAITIPVATYAVGDYWAWEAAAAPSVSAVTAALQSGSTGAMTVSGAAFDDFQVVVEVLRPGTNTQAVFRVSLDNGASFVPHIYGTITVPTITNAGVTSTTSPWVNLTLAGAVLAPPDNYAVQIQIVTGGPLGTATYRYSTDGGVTFNSTNILTPQPTSRSSSQFGAVPSGNFADPIVATGAGQVPATQIVPWFDAGTYTANDVYAWTVTAGVAMAPTYVVPGTGDLCPATLTTTAAPGLTLQFSGTFKTGDRFSFTTSAKRNSVFRMWGTSLAVSELCIYLAPYRQPRACFDITQSFAPGRRSTACEVKRVYVYGSLAGASGGMCRDVIVVGGNRAAQQGVLAQADPPDCENHVFEEVNADVGSTLDAGLAVPNVSGQAKNLYLRNFASSGSKWVVNGAAYSLNGVGVGGSHIQQSVLRTLGSDDPIRMEYTQFEGTPMLAECFGPGQQVTFSGGRLDAERSQNMHGILALLTNCGPFTIKNCELAAYPGTRLRVRTSGSANCAVITIQGCTVYNQDTEQLVECAAGTRAWLVSTGNAGRFTASDTMNSGPGTGAAAKLWIDPLTPFDGPIVGAGATPTPVVQQVVGARVSDAVTPIRNSSITVRFGASETLKKATLPVIEDDGEVVWCPSAIVPVPPTTGAATHLTAATRLPSQRSVLVELSGAPGGGGVDVTLVPKRPTAFTSSVDPVDPTVLGAPVWWLDPGWDQAIDLTTGEVSSVTDRSASPRNPTASGTDRPLRKATGGPNANPYWNFFGKKLVAPLLSAILGGGYTIFAVARPIAGTAGTIGIFNGVELAWTSSFGGLTRQVTHLGNRVGTDSSASPHGMLGRWELWEVTWTPSSAAVLKINGVVHAMTSPPTTLNNPSPTLTLVNGDSADIGYAIVFASDLSASNPSGMTALRNALMSQFRIF